MLARRAQRGGLLAHPGPPAAGVAHAEVERLGLALGASTVLAVNERERLIRALPRRSAPPRRACCSSNGPQSGPPTQLLPICERQERCSPRRSTSCSTAPGALSGCSMWRAAAAAAPGRASQLRGPARGRGLALAGRGPGLKVCDEEAFSGALDRTGRFPGRASRARRSRRSPRTLIAVRRTAPRLHRARRPGAAAPLCALRRVPRQSRRAGASRCRAAEQAHGPPTARRRLPPLGPGAAASSARRLRAPDLGQRAGPGAARPRPARRALRLPQRAAPALSASRPGSTPARRYAVPARTRPVQLSRTRPRSAAAPVTDTPYTGVRRLNPGSLLLLDRHGTREQSLLGAAVRRA